MKYGRILFTLATLSLAACSTGKSTDGAAAASKTFDVLGTYRNDDSNEWNKEYLRIEKDRVTLVKVCKADDLDRVVNYVKGADSKARVEVTVPARITDTSIELLASAEKSGPLAGCVAKLDKGVMTYLFNRYDDLFVTAEGKTQTRFNRLGEPQVGFGRRFTNAIGLTTLPANPAEGPQSARPGIADAQGAMATSLNDSISNAQGKLATDLSSSVSNAQGKLATGLNDSISKDQGAAATKAGEALKAAAPKVMETLGNNPPMVQ